MVTSLDMFAMAPLVATVAADLDASLETVLRALSAYLLAYGLGQPVWGLVSDRWGRVRTIRVTLFLAGVLSIASVATTSILALTVVRGVAGGLFGAAFPASLVYLGDTVAAERRQRDIAQLLVGVAVGASLASLGAGVVADVLSWRLAFVVSGSLAVIMSWRLKTLPEPLRSEASPRLTAGVRRMARSGAALGVVTLAFCEGALLLAGLNLVPTAIEASGHSAAQAGLATAGYGLAVCVSAFALSRLSPMWRAERLIAAGAAAGVLGWLAFALSRHPAIAFLVVLLMGWAWTAMHSSLQTWATEVLPEARATVVSFFAAALFVGGAAASSVAAAPAEAGHYGELYAVAAVALVPVGLVAAWSRRRWRGTTGAGDGAP